MGPILVMILLAVFSLAILQAVVRRRRNPYGDVLYEGLSAELRAEIARVLPGFMPGPARLTRDGDEAHLDGHYLGEPVRIEADFDPSGALVDFEMDGPRGSGTRKLVAAEDLPEPARREIDRVLGADRESFQPTLVKGGESQGEPHFERKGMAGEWKWEITVSASGRLLEVEKERRRGARS